MKKLRLISAFCTSVLLLGASTSANSAIVSLDYVFDDVTLSGSFSYDDTTSTPLNGVLDGFTAYTPTFLGVTYSSGDTMFSWSIADHVPFGSDYSFSPTIDPAGTWLTGDIRIAPIGWANATFINAQGATLTFDSGVRLGDPNTWGLNIVARVKAPVTSNVLATGIYMTTPSAVPLPGAVWIFGSGLLGLIGIARHKKA